MTIKMARITMRKYMGDDQYSWAVFRDGKVVVAGLSRKEAAYHLRRVKELEAKK